MYPVPRILKSGSQGKRPTWIPSLVVGLALCLAPAWLWHEAVDRYLLKLDDYAYLASSRDPGKFVQNAWKPHNTHVVPLFRLETHLLLRGAGSLKAAPVWLSAGAYATLVLAILATGHLVARETNRVEFGLMAMAGIGLSTILGPSFLWYSASQATMSGVVILATLIVLQAWRTSPHAILLVLAFAGCAVAPLVWSAGYAAGPVAAVYLWADGRRRCRAASVIPMLGTLITFMSLWFVLDHRVIPESPADQPWEGWPSRCIRTCLLTTQTIGEFLIFGNLGLDIETAVSKGQGVVFSLVLALAWIASHFRRTDGWKSLRPSPLEAAGATLALVSLVMVYLARGSYQFQNLRSLGWYHSVPQIGAVLGMIGWYASRGAPSAPRTLNPPKARSIAGVLTAAFVIYCLQAPRAHRIMFQYDGLAAPVHVQSEPSPDPASEVGRRNERFDRQTRFLKTADRIEQACYLNGITRADFQRVFGTMRIPETPMALAKLSVGDLLRFPEVSRVPDSARIRELIEPLFTDSAALPSP